MSQYITVTIMNYSSPVHVPFSDATSEKHPCNPTSSGAHSASYPMNTRGLFPYRVKRLGHEADRSPPSSAKVKNVWSYTSTPPICLHGMVLG